MKLVSAARGAHASRPRGRACPLGQQVSGVRSAPLPIELGAKAGFQDQAAALLRSATNRARRVRRGSAAPAEFLGVAAGRLQIVLVVSRAGSGA